MNNLDLSKYKNLKFKEITPVTLFEPDWRVAVKEKRCPLCLCKLYEMRGKPFWYCRSKKHKNRFIISNDKMK